MRPIKDRRRPRRPLLRNLQQPAVKPKAKTESFQRPPKQERTPAAEAPANTATTDTAPAAPVKPAAAPAAKPKVKHAAKPSPCKGLEEAACGSNKVCKWTAPQRGTRSVTTPHCSSVAAVKKKHPAKTAKTPRRKCCPGHRRRQQLSAWDGSAAAPAASTNAVPRKLKPRSQKRRTPKPKADRALFRRVRTVLRLVSAGRGA